MTDGTKKDGHHVVPDGRHFKCDIVKFEMPLHMHVVVLTYKVNATIFFFYFYLLSNKCDLNTFNTNTISKAELVLSKVKVA